MNEEQLEGTQQAESVNAVEPNNQQATTITGDVAGAETQTAGRAEINYDFNNLKLPEGFELSTEEQGRFVDVIRDMGISNENANAIAQYGAEYGNRVASAVLSMKQQEIAGWGEAAKQELGADLDKTVALCGSAVEHMEKTCPGLREALNETGAGNRIEIIRVLAEMGKMLNSDPGMAAGIGAGAAKSGVDNNSMIAKMYSKTDFSKYR